MSSVGEEHSPSMALAFAYAQAVNGSPPTGDLELSLHRPIGTPSPKQFSYSFFHTDHLGSPRLVTDPNGNEVARQKYLPFGEELQLSGSTRNTHKFTGHERDAETGLDYMHARFYSPRAVRFGSTDPAGPQHIWNATALNRFSYVHSNPMGFIDPDGQVVVPAIVWCASNPMCVNAVFAGLAATSAYLAGNTTTATTLMRNDRRNQYPPRRGPQTTRPKETPDPPLRPTPDPKQQPPTGRDPYGEFKWIVLAGAVTEMKSLFYTGGAVFVNVPHIVWLMMQETSATYTDYNTDTGEPSGQIDHETTDDGYLGVYVESGGAMYDHLTGSQASSRGGTYAHSNNANPHQYKPGGWVIYK
ncbi:MAG: RHS repeat-associated core domain-containing protein [Nitrososphaera sp.]